MNKLSDEENRARKAVRGQEYNYIVVLSFLRRDCVEPDLTLGGLVRVPHVPPPVSFVWYVDGMV